MIVALDHTVLVCPDLEAAISDFKLLLGRRPDWTADTDQIGTALFCVDNTAIELTAPQGRGPQSDRLREIIDRAGGPSLTSLVFTSDQISEDHHRFGRRQLDPAELIDGSSQERTSGEIRHWKRFRLSDQSTVGIKTFVIAHQSDRVSSPGTSADQVHSLDHLVVNTTHPERAVANYGGRLGLNLALDRTEPKWGVRFLFFRIGGLTLEFVHKLSDRPTDSDQLWGLTWAVKDLAAAKARLDQSGVKTSEIRTGRKPGSQVFTVKSHSLGVPTLFISHQPKPVS